MKNDMDAGIFRIVAGTIQLEFPIESETQSEKLTALFARAWEFYPNTDTNHLYFCARLWCREFLAVITIDPDCEPGPGRLKWTVDDRSGNVKRVDGPDATALLIELADHLDDLCAPLAPSIAPPRFRRSSHVPSVQTRR